MQARSVKYGGSNLWSLDESMCRISQVFYEISSALYKRGKSVLADFRYVSSEALSEDIWSLISRSTAVDHLSIEVSVLMKIALGLPWTHFVFNFKQLFCDIGDRLTHFVGKACNFILVNFSGLLPTLDLGLLG